MAFSTFSNDKSCSFCPQIFLLLFILLYLMSFMLIEKFRRRDSEDYLSADEDEVKVYRISLWLCTFALAVSLGSALLLPVSIVSNEVLILYPNSYYVKWLNSSLIQGKRNIFPKTFERSWHQTYFRLLESYLAKSVNTAYS